MMRIPLPSTGNLIAEMSRLANRLEAETEALMASAVEKAEAEGAYKLALAKAYLDAEGPVRERESRAELSTNAARVRAGIAEGMDRAHLEAVRSLRQQLSAAQSVAGAIRAEAELAGKGPG